MGSRITRLVSRPERISRQKAEDARQAVLNLELPKPVTETMLVAIARHTSTAGDMGLPHAAADTGLNRLGCNPGVARQGILRF
jgi:hypothetical protein